MNILKLTTLGASVFAVGIAQAAQPVFNTPSPVSLLPNIVYVIPYAVSTAGLAETVVTINAALPGAAAPCLFQVQWLDFNGATQGISGDGTAASNPPANGSFEYTTVRNGGAVSLFPFVLNVFRNSEKDFEGYANIRSTCAASAKVGVDAEFVVFQQSTSAPTDMQYRQIEPIKKAGNVGE